jgi:hypothetical protein
MYDFCCMISEKSRAQPGFNNIKAPVMKVRKEHEN